MANYSAIKAAVNAYIKANGRKEITGSILNAVLNATIDSLGRYFQFAGGAMPTDDPGTPDQNVCYLAGEPGVYIHFGNIRINNEEVALLFWNGEWVKQTIAIGIQEVNASVDNQVGTPSVDVDYSGGQLVLTFHNLKGEQGEVGDPAGFGTIGAAITGDVGTPGVSVETSGDNRSKNIMFHFTNLKGETGVQSVVATIDNTSGIPSCQASLVNGVLTLAFSGLKGLQGNTGSSVDYPFTIANNLTTDDPTQALSAAMGVQLEGEISQLETKVDELLDGVPTEQTLVRYSRVQRASLKTTGAVETITSTSSIVDLFSISGNSLIKVSGRVGASANSCLVCFYDADDNFITGSASYPTPGTATPVLDYEVTSPANAVWMRVAGNTTSDYSPAAKVFVAGVGIPERVSDLENEVADLKSVNPGFDLRGMPHEVINGFYIAGSTQKWTEADGGVEHIFKVKKGQRLNIVGHATLTTNYAFISSYSYLADGATPYFIPGHDNTYPIPAGQTIAVEIPADCYLAVNCATSSSSTRYPQHIYINGDNPFFGLKSIWQGPSTMYGLGTSPLSTRFSERVARYFGMSHTNYAQSGSTIAKKPGSYESAFGSMADFNAAIAGGQVDTSKRYLVKDGVNAALPWTIYYYDGSEWVSVTRNAANVERSPMVDRLSELDADADVIVFLGSSNDFMYDWTEIGENTDRINTTIKGAMHLICQHLVTNYPNKFILWINSAVAYRYQGDYTTPFAKNNLGYSGWEEADAVREVLKQYSIPYIDMAGEGGLTPENSGWWDDYDSPGTRVHPNATGYLRLTKYLVSKMLELKNIVV